MTPAEWRDLVYLYAAGELDAAEQDAVRAKLESGDPETVAIYKDARETLADLIEGSADVESPSSDAKSTLLERVRPGRDTGATDKTVATPPKRSVGPLLAGLAAGVLLGALISAIVTLQLLESRHNEELVDARAESAEEQRRVRDQLNALNTELTAAEDELAVLESLLERYRNRLGAPQLAVVPMEPADGRPEAERARLLLDPATGRWDLLAFNLPRLADDRVYEFWLLDNRETPISAGTFTVDETGQGRLSGDAIPQGVTSLNVLGAITEEQLGGSATGQPTLANLRVIGDPVLLPTASDE